jgi:hypothetical protein
MSMSLLSLFDFRFARPSKVWKSGEIKQKMRNSGEILKIIHEITYYFYEEIRGKENKICGKNKKKIIIMWKWAKKKLATLIPPDLMDGSQGLPLFVFFLLLSWAVLCPKPYL